MHKRKSIIYLKRFFSRFFPPLTDSFGYTLFSGPNASLINMQILFKFNIIQYIMPPQSLLAAIFSEEVRACFHTSIINNYYLYCRILISCRRMTILFYRVLLYNTSKQLRVYVDINCSTILRV